MKKLILLFLLCSSGLICQTTTAQVSFKINIGLQPVWGPVGYDHVEYYYLPEIETYYYVPTHQYTYMERGRWVTTSSLPMRYRNFDVYKARKVVINDPKPYMHHQNYKMKYARSNGNSHQQLIRDSRDSKYFEIKDHPEHSKWKGNQNDKRQDMNNKRDDQNNKRQDMNNKRDDQNNKGQKDNNKGQKDNNKGQKQDQKNDREHN